MKKLNKSKKIKNTNIAGFDSKYERSEYSSEGKWLYAVYLHNKKEIDIALNNTMSNISGEIIYRPSNYDLFKNLYTTYKNKEIKKYNTNLEKKGQKRKLIKKNSKIENSIEKKAMESVALSQAINPKYYRYQNAIKGLKRDKNILDTLKEMSAQHGGTKRLDLILKLENFTWDEQAKRYIVNIVDTKGNKLPNYISVYFEDGSIPITYLNDEYENIKTQELKSKVFN